uniref:Vacuolar protein 8 n=1 Tax=Tetraselmis sp. GSL018 TaxID=582737 RepID=A0A061SH38_9CHLO|eukprot:CAMPEP_0177589050 /NCGR_PEP_ID=MMETSP0419_2-20121207/6576_1 /TAXON_ID=582737 /ORGANISM="Tetraselmis sp., Strain GSL018" /LENGTH=460 /DNA_ID=CAMNT_0019079337 /DNA_START=673 /DNA_END=2055 /DNA_ORIENTATION=-
MNSSTPGSTNLSTTREQRKGFKRKLADGGIDGTGAASEVAPVAEIQRLIEVLRLAQKKDGLKEFASLRRAAHALAEIAKSEDSVDVIVREGGVEAAVPLLSEIAVEDTSTSGRIDEVQKEICFTLGLLAIKADHQYHIANAGALTGLIAILKQRCNDPVICPYTGGVVRRAADAITNLAHENAHIKSKVRLEGGIPPLVELLDSMDPKVQRAAAGALRTLAFKNEENKRLIVESGTLPVLVQMLRSDDVGIHYEAVGVIGNLVHSSPTIKRQVLDEGALQPVISLLSSACTESQREAALLLGQFATADPDFKAKIVQRGAVPPLITMLTAADLQLKEMAAFALGRLAQNPDNQAGIIHAGGLKPFLDLIDSNNGNLQHNAAFALYGLADNDDNIAEIIRTGGVQRLMNSNLIVQPSKDCVQKTLKRLEEKIHGKVLKQVFCPPAGKRCQAWDNAMFQAVS